MNDRRAWLAPGWAWLAVALTLALPALFLGVGEASHPWVLRRGMAPAHDWPRLFSTAWVHLDVTHLRLNMAALSLLALAGWRLRLQTRWALAWALAWPLGHAALLAGPLALAWVAGASGALHGGVAVLSVALWAQCRRPWAAFMLLSGLVFKLGMESGWVQPVQITFAHAFPVAVAAHLAGAVAGWAMALLSASGFHSLRLSGR